MSNEQQPGDLKPRAIAVLVALRGGSRTALSLQRALGDASPAQTLALIDDMTVMGLVGQRPGRTLPSDHRYLTREGAGWLADHGLETAPEAMLWVEFGAGLGVAP